MSQELTELFRERIKARFPSASSYAFSRKHSHLQLLKSDYPNTVIAGETAFKPWRIIEDVTQSEFDVSTMRPCWFIRGRKSVPGPKMREWAKKLNAYWGRADGKRMLVEQYKIPAKMQEYYIPFPATVLLTHEGDQVIPYLCYEKGQWVMDFNLLDYEWPDNGRLALFASSIVEEEIESTIVRVA